MKKTSILFTLIVFASAASAQNAFNKSGRTALQFLKIGIGARPAALGEACIANVQDANAVFWNPAAIAGVEKAEASFTYTKWFADLNIMAGAVAWRAGSLGVFALNYVSLDYGEIQEALVTSPTGGVDTRTGQTFSGNDLAIGLAFSRSYTDKLSLGVNVKYIRERLFTYTNSQWAFDVGSYYDTGWRGIRLAMSAQNFSSQARWLKTREEEQQNHELPLLFRIGWSIDLLGGEKLFLGGDPMQQRFTLNMDAIHSNDYAERLHIGGEYVLHNLIALRGGYRFNYEEGNLSYGAGFQYNTGGVGLKIDYGYVTYDFLDNPHRFTLSATF